MNNHQMLLGSSLKAHTYDMIKSKINKQKLERSRILNELMNQKQEVQAIIDLSSSRHKVKKHSEDTRNKIRHRSGHSQTTALPQKLKHSTKAGDEASHLHAAAGSAAGATQEPPIPVGTHHDEKNNVQKYRHLQKVISEAIQGQKCSDKATVRGFHSLIVKRGQQGRTGRDGGSATKNGNVLESITDRFEKITQKSSSMNGRVSLVNQAGQLLGTGQSANQSTQMSHYLPIHLSSQLPPGQKWLGSIKSIQSIQSLHTIKSINSMKTNQSINSLVSNQRLWQKEREAALQQLDEAKRDLVATADRIYDDEDDIQSENEHLTEESHFGSQQPLCTHQFKNAQVQKQQSIIESSNEQSQLSELANMQNGNGDSQGGRSGLSVYGLTERPSKPKKNEGRTQKFNETTKVHQNDKMRIETQQQLQKDQHLSAGSSTHEIMNTAPLGQTRERILEKPDENNTSPQTTQQQFLTLEQLEQRGTQRAKFNQSVLQNQRTDGSGAFQLNADSQKAMVEKLEKYDNSQVGFRIATQIDEQDNQQLPDSSTSRMLIESQRSKIDEYQSMLNTQQLQSQQDEPITTNADYNPYEKIIQRNDQKELEEEKKAARSPLLTQRSSVATSKASSYPDAHIIMTNSSMAKLKKKLGQIVPDRQYQMPKYMIIKNDQSQQLNPGQESSPTDAVPPSKAERAEPNAYDKKFLEMYVFAENKDKKEILNMNQKQLSKNLSRSPAELKDAIKIDKHNKSKIFLQDNNRVTVNQVLIEDMTNTGVFKNKIGDSIGEGALESLGKGGTTGLLPKMTHIRDLSPLSTRDLVLQASASQASLDVADSKKQSANKIHSDAPLLTQDQEKIMSKMRQSPSIKQSFDLAARTEQDESMNNRAMGSVFTTLNDIDYDKNAISKSMAPIHAFTSAIDRDKRVSNTTHKRLQQQQNTQKLNLTLPRKNKDTNMFTLSKASINGRQTNRNQTNEGKNKNVNLESLTRPKRIATHHKLKDSYLSHQAPKVTDIMSRHPSKVAIKHIQEQSERMRKNSNSKTRLRSIEYEKQNIGGGTGLGTISQQGGDLRDRPSIPSNQTSGFHNQQDKARNSSCGIPQFKLLNNAEDSIRFRSKLEVFKQMTTQPNRVFDKGNGCINSRLQSSIDLPPTSQLLQQHTNDPVSQAQLSSGSNINNSSYIQIIKQTQTPPNKKEQLANEALNNSLKLNKYHEWKDVEKCLIASLDQNYKDLLHKHSENIAAPYSSYHHHQSLRNQKYSSLQKNKNSFGRSSRISEMQGTLDNLKGHSQFDMSNKPSLQGMDQMTPLYKNPQHLSRLKDSFKTANIESTSTPSATNNLFEMQKLYYSNLNISKLDNKPLKQKKQQLRYQNTQKGTEQTPLKSRYKQGPLQQTDYSLERKGLPSYGGAGAWDRDYDLSRVLPHQRVIQSMTGTIEAFHEQPGSGSFSPNRGSKLPSLPQISAQKHQIGAGFPFQ